jgi:hypothetical protein
VSLLSRLGRRGSAPTIAPAGLDEFAGLARDPETPAGTLLDAHHILAADPDDDPIRPQVPGPTPKPCCSLEEITRGWSHGPDCTLVTVPAERFPLAGPRQPLITCGGRWEHLNGAGR